MNNSIIERLKEPPRSKITGQDIMDLARFSPNTRHMIVFDVLKDECPVGFKGERIRVFHADEGYEQALQSQKRSKMKVKTHAAVKKGDLFYDNRETNAR